MSDGRLPVRHHWVGWTIGLALIAVALVTAWILVRGLGAASELHGVRNAAAQLRSAIADREIERAERIAPRIAQHAALARELTSDPIWRGFEFIPWLGANFTAVREVAEITDSVAAGTATAVVRATAEIDPVTLGFTGSRIDLGPLPAVETSLDSAAEALSSADGAAQRIDIDAALPPIADAVRDARGFIHDAAGAIGTMHGTSALLPGMLGQGGPRMHLVMLQNNAELRSQGGVVSALALVRAENGTMSIVHTVSARDLVGSIPARDESTTALFGDDPDRSTRDATSAPDFASAAATVAERWQQHYGDTIDGVVAVDLVAAARLAEATGTVSFGTYSADADTLVPVLTAEVPAAFSDAGQRDAVFAQATASLLSAVLSTSEPAEVLEAVATAAADDRIRVWSARPDEQALLGASTLSGMLPQDGQRGIHVGVLINDETGAPLGAHTHATISTAVGVCQGEPTTQVTVTWENDVPEEVAASIPTSGDLASGQTRTRIAIYGPEGTTISEGEATATLGTRPVVQHDVTLSPGESETVTVSFSGVGERLTHLHHTPLLEGPGVTREAFDCG